MFTASPLPPPPLSPSPPAVVVALGAAAIAVAVLVRVLLWCVIELLLAPFTVHSINLQDASKIDV